MFNEQNIKVHQIETELYFKHKCYKEALAKLNKQPVKHYGQQMGLGQATGALGQSQLGIGQYQQGLAGLVPQLYGQDTAAYGAAGAQTTSTGSGRSRCK